MRGGPVQVEIFYKTCVSKDLFAVSLKFVSDLCFFNVSLTTKGEYFIIRNINYYKIKSTVQRHCTNIFQLLILKTKTNCNQKCQFQK